MANPVREEPPTCFGKLWDPKAKECTGGMDPAFTDENGSHVRDKCIFYESCGTKLQASRMEPARGLLDPRNLVTHVQRPTLQVPTSTPAAPPSQLSGFVQKFAQAVAQQPAAIQPYTQPSALVSQPRMSQPAYPPMQQQQYIPHHPQYTHHLQAPPAQVPYGYQQMMPVNYQMPGYLTVPEIRQPDQSFFGFAARTVLRSMGKSMGHSIAHLFDTVPLGAPVPPRGNGDL